MTCPLRIGVDDSEVWGLISLLFVVGSSDDVDLVLPGQTRLSAVKPFNLRCARRSVDNGDIVKGNEQKE